MPHRTGGRIILGKLAGPRSHGYEGIKTLVERNAARQNTRKFLIDSIERAELHPEEVAHLKLLLRKIKGDPHH